MSQKQNNWDPAKFNFFYFFIALLAIVLLQNLLNQRQEVQEIPYNQFINLLDEGRVERLRIGENEIRGEVSSPRESEAPFFKTNKVETDLADRLSKHNIEFARVIENTFFRDLFSWLFPLFIFFAIWLYLLKRMASKSGMGGGLMSVGKSKAKIYVQTDTQVSFDDVAGVDEAKAELEEIVDFLKNAQKYHKLGGKMPKGVLLVGPPGTGKTLLAKAIAGESKVTFFSISGSEFVEMFVGVGAARVRDLFEQARAKAPCIIFIDELDALGKARGANIHGGHDEKEQTLNQLLTELDGFDSKEGIILLGATNRPEILDPALLRAGRFDRQVLVDRPDKKGRIDILKVHTRKIALAEGVDLEQVAALTTGFTGADLANLVNEAAIFATRRNASVVELDDFTRAIERIVAGLERKNRLLNDFEREVVAYHEMGHALVARALSGTEKVHKVSIIPRGIGALGYTIQRPTEDRFLMRKEELENKMAVLMGGRASEKLIFGHLSTGASDDLAKVTDIAKNMVMKYAMSEELGHMTYDKEASHFLATSMANTREYSEQTAREIDLEVKKISIQAFQKALDILQSNIDLLHQSAKKLLKKETLDSDELEEIFKKVKEDKRE